MSSVLKDKFNEVRAQLGLIPTRLYESLALNENHGDKWGDNHILAYYTDSPTKIFRPAWLQQLNYISEKSRGADKKIAADFIAQAIPSIIADDNGRHPSDDLIRQRVRAVIEKARLEGEQALAELKTPEEIVGGPEAVRKIFKLANDANSSMWGSFTSIYDWKEKVTERKRALEIANYNYAAQHTKVENFNLVANTLSQIIGEPDAYKPVPHPWHESLMSIIAGNERKIRDENWNRMVEENRRFQEGGKQQPSGPQ